MFNNIKWWARPFSANWCLCDLEWEERVVASLVMCPWFNTFEYFFHRRERALGLFSTTAYVNGPFLHIDTSSRYAQ